MRIYPAIDLRKGRCVRLRRGDPNAETVFSDDPAQMASHWAALGAEWLHVVNLDGAFGGASGGASDFHPRVQRLSPDALETGDPDRATDPALTGGVQAEASDPAQNLPIN
ncbi:MAG: HisA/HisF-related TIM barrel protein, partial [Caldilineaceae bacterium]|nr:HisA/HisF-related TIM barrel protein [Caldilineaceae bacterium]